MVGTFCNHAQQKLTSHLAVFYSLVFSRDIITHKDQRKKEIAKSWSWVWGAEYYSGLIAGKSVTVKENPRDHTQAPGHAANTAGRGNLFSSFLSLLSPSKQRKTIYE